MRARKEVKRLPEKDVLIRRAIDALLQNEDGRELVMWLFERCGYNTPCLAIDPRTMEIRSESTTYNLARRTIYLDLRDLATGALLAPVEEEAEARARAKAETREHAAVQKIKTEEG